MHVREVAAITSRLEPEMTVLEYGSGGSTAAFAGLVARFVSIEHDAAWHARVKATAEAEGLRPGGWLFFHDFFKPERCWQRLPELERHYELVEAMRDTEQTLAVFQRR